MYIEATQSALQKVRATGVESRIIWYEKKLQSAIKKIQKLTQAAVQANRKMAELNQQQYEKEVACKNAMQNLALFQRALNKPETVASQKAELERLAAGAS